MVGGILYYTDNQVMKDACTIKVAESYITKKHYPYNVVLFASDRSSILIVHYDPDLMDRVLFMRVSMGMKNYYDPENHSTVPTIVAGIYSRPVDSELASYLLSNGFIQISITRLLDNYRLGYLDPVSLDSNLDISHGYVTRSLVNTLDLTSMSLPVRVMKSRDFSDEELILMEDKIPQRVTFYDLLKDDEFHDVYFIRDKTSLPYDSMIFNW